MIGARRTSVGQTRSRPSWTLRCRLIVSSHPIRMASRIEDYAMIGDCQTAALVARNGSIDWLCWPRFDSAACFAALLGSDDNGRWRISPADPEAKVRRRYRDGTLILETEFETSSG